MYTTVFGDERKYDIYQHDADSLIWAKELKKLHEKESFINVKDPTKTVKLLPQEEYIQNILINEDEVIEDIIIHPISKEEFKELEKIQIMETWERLINEN